MAAIFTIPFDIDPSLADRSGFRPARRAQHRTVVDLDRRGHGQAMAFTPHERVRLAIGAVAISVLAVLGSAVVFAVIDAASQPPATTPVVRSVGGISAAEANQVVVVQSGDTLTSIARRLQPTGDVQQLVDKLAAIHGPAALQPGERLSLVNLHLTSGS